MSGFGRQRTACIHQPTYLPWLGFFDKLLASDVWVVLDDVELSRQSWITRVNIRGGNGPLMLSVPVHHRFSEHAPLRDIRLDLSRPWRRKHERAIRQTYGGLPYFHEIEELIKTTFSGDHTFLMDLTMAGIEWLRVKLGIAVEVRYSSALQVVGLTGTERLVALTRAAEAAVYVSGAGSRGYLEPERFHAAGLGLAWQDYVEQPYAQRGRGGFIGKLSVIDALANLGARGTAAMLRAGHRAPVMERAPA